MTQNAVEKIVLQILKTNGFDKLPEADQQSYLMQFTAEAEKRLGLAVMPLLNESAAEEFSKLMQGGASQEQWADFWKSNVPNFDEVVKKTMDEYAKEIAAAFNR